MNSERKTLLLILLAPPLFLIHGLEEILRMPAFLAANAARLPALYAGISTAQFTLAIATLTLLTLLVAGLAARHPQPGPAMTVFAFIAAARLANVLIHLVQVILFRSLTPGAYTALPILLPTAVLILRQLRKEDLITRRQLRATLLAGLPLHVLIAPLLLLSGWVINM